MESASSICLLFLKMYLLCDAVYHAFPYAIIKMKMNGGQKQISGVFCVRFESGCQIENETVRENEKYGTLCCCYGCG